MGVQTHAGDEVNPVAIGISLRAIEADSGPWAGVSYRRSRPIWHPVLSLALLTIVLLCNGPAFAGVTASISGTVRDQSGAAIVGATVTATNTDTNVAETQPTNGQGFYSFLALPLGHYRINI